ncbi:MAG TPA: glycosyltransferase 87 family protein [Bryobacteraceae bacterium]|nr:glycosyltransferase 87 family protein [Bryobacteraceae bacterium]
MGGLTPKQRRAAILIVAAIAFFAKIVLALKTYGTNDVYTYERFGLWSRYLGVALYRIAPDLNHPPSMLHFLSALLRLADFTHLPFHFWLRFWGILADAGSLWLVWRIAGEQTALLLIAISPISILISGFHGNTDPLMIFFVLLAVWLAGYRDRALPAGAAFGLAFCIKITPVIAAPVLLFWLPDWRRRVKFFGAAAAVTVAGWSPFLFDDPAAVVHQVFGYRSSYGLWGVSWLLRQLAVAWPATWRVNLIYSQTGSVLVLAAVTILAIAMNRMRNRPSLYAQVGMAFLFFFVFTGGFAVQYLAWLTPWIAELGAAPVALFVATGSVFLLVVYNYWTLGAPWYLAIAYPWNTHQYFQVLCWLSVAVMAVTAWLRIRRGNNFLLRFRLPISPLVAWSGAGVAFAAFLIYPAYIHMRRDRLDVSPVYAEDDALYTEADIYHNLAVELSRRGRRADANAVEARSELLMLQGDRASDALLREQPGRSNLTTPESLVEASLEDYDRGDFAKCVYDAKESLKLRPGMPAAWNNIALCYGELGNWERAAAAAEEGFRLEPEVPEVRQNLEWAVAQKERAQRGR